MPPAMSWMKRTKKPDRLDYSLTQNYMQSMQFSANGKRPQRQPFRSQFLLLMKLTTALLLATCLQVSARAISQTVTLRLSNAPLEKTLKDIAAQTGYELFYRLEQMKEARAVSIEVHNADLKSVLDLIFSNQPFTYAIANKTIILSQRATARLTEISRDPSPPGTLHGVVGSGNGPLAGVTVTVKGTSRATSTDAKGEFTLNGLHEKDILIFSYVGYKSQEVNVKKASELNILLEKALTNLDQAVVIAYGSVKKKDLTGSVSTIEGRDIEDIPFNTVDNAIAGKAAGVQVTKTDGSPGGAVRIRIRGSSSLLGGNDPLYVIDGVPLQVQSNFQSPGYDIGNPAGNDASGLSVVNAGLSTSFVNGLNSLGGLNVDDIESITILKDASSTAIYGSKAANGVVIITTKKGKKDMIPQITGSYYTTVSGATKPHVLNAAQYKQLLTESAQNDYTARVAANQSIPADLKAVLDSSDIYFGKANTNWLDAVTRIPVSHNAELAVQGGSNKSRYFTSISFNNTPGVLSATNYQRVSGKLNLENEISSHFSFLTNMILGYTNQDIGDGVYTQALRARPDFTPYDSSGNFFNFSRQGQPSHGFLNPAALLRATNNAKTFNLLGSISGIYAITHDLQFKSTVSLNSQYYNQRNYTPSFLELGSFSGNVANQGGIGGNSNSRLTDWFIENTLSFNKQFNEKHSLEVLVGTSYETRKNSSFSATAQGYPNDNVLTGLSSAVTPFYVSGDDPSKPQSYLLSFYARANYSLLDKYLFTFTGRADGSSKFGPDNKYGYFPSGAIGWRLSKENFLKNTAWIDDLKLRGSYGATGTQNIGDQMYRTLFTPASYGGSSALLPTQVGNPAIKWESTLEANVGLDLSIYKGRFQLTTDYYNKHTSGVLLSLPVAPSSSYSNLLRNAVGIRNTGYELSLTGDIIRTHDFKWTASVNITWIKSVVTKLDPDADLSQIGDLTGLEYQNTALIQGQPLGLLTGIKVTGIIRTQADLDAYKKRLGRYNRFPTLGIGDPIYALNNEHSASGSNPNYYSIIGQGAPKYFGGFTQGFTYKQFDLQLYFTYSAGGHLLWADHASSVQFAGTGNANVAMLERYTPQNPDSKYPRLMLDDPNYYKSNLDVFSSSYIKLRTVTFNYHLSKAKWMEQAGLHNASIFASATNLLTITKYPGNDPETSDDPYSVGGGYFDVSNYPKVKTFSLGIKAGF